MSDTPKKSGCFSTAIKAFVLLAGLAIVAAILLGVVVSKRETTPTATSDTPTPQPRAGEQTPKREPRDVAKNATPRAASPTVAPAPFDIAAVSEAELPKQVTLKTAETFNVPGTSGTVAVPAGARADVLSRSGETLTLRFVSGQKQVHYTKTNFVDEVAAVRAKREQMDQARKQQLAQAAKAQAEADNQKKAAALLSSVRSSALHIRGTVLQIIEGGALVTEFTERKGQGFLDHGDEIIAIAGIGDGLVDGSQWEGIIYPCGRLQYKSVLGAGKTVAKYTTSEAVAVMYARGE